MNPTTSISKISERMDKRTNNFMHFPEFLKILQILGRLVRGAVRTTETHKLRDGVVVKASTSKTKSIQLFIEMMQPLIFILSYIVVIVGVDGFVALPHFNLWKFSHSRGESPQEQSASHFSFISYTSPKATFRSQQVQETAHYARPSKSSSSSSGSSSHSTTSPGTDSSNSIPFGTSPVKIEALKGVVDVIEKNYGKGSIQKLGEAKAMNVETTSSGSITLDMALGGGYPRGRVVEIFGPESSGKTTLALHAIAEVQKSGGGVLCYIYILY